MGHSSNERRRRRSRRAPRRRASAGIVGIAVLALLLVGLVAYGVGRSLGSGDSASQRDPSVTEPAHPGAEASGSLWAVKIGTDPQARQVNLSPVRTTIASLTSRPKSTNHRVAPVEFTVYTVTATLTRLYQEHDLDQHLTIEDDDGHHMLADLPDASVVSTSVFRREIERVHAQLAAWRGTLPAKVRITGVGFFDEVTGQPDQAPNQIELHPVLDIHFEE